MLSKSCTCSVQISAGAHEHTNPSALQCVLRRFLSLLSVLPLPPLPSLLSRSTASRPTTRRRSTSCRTTTGSSSPTSSPASACWAAWLPTTASRCSRGLTSQSRRGKISDGGVSIADSGARVISSPQPAGGPGDAATRSTPEDPAAPHGFVRPGISGPQSAGRPLRGHPLAHFSVRSAARHQSFFFFCNCHRKDILRDSRFGKRKVWTRSECRTFIFGEGNWRLMFSLHFIVSDCTPPCTDRVQC